jgi:hypothetical protein
MIWYKKLLFISSSFLFTHFNIICGGDLFTVSGNASYDLIFPKINQDENSVYLDYDNKQKRPIRRAIVHALLNDIIIDETSTDEDGFFSLRVNEDDNIDIRILAKSIVTDFSRNHGCYQATWEISVVDNTSNDALYVLQTPENFSVSDYINDDFDNEKLFNIHAPVSYLKNNGYIKRIGAPFAVLDTIINTFDLVCPKNKKIKFPPLIVKWSEKNNTSFGNFSSGNIGTSFYTEDIEGTANLYLLGQENDDTDEFDRHVIVHELGHYIEDRLFRSDTIGGTHHLEDSLQASLAFSEGFSNAFSAMALNDPLYVDNIGDITSPGFFMQIDESPKGVDDKGIYSERSNQYFLWNLYENRDSDSFSGNFDRIFTVLNDFQKKTEAFTTLLSFSAYYHKEYGPLAESLKELWSDDTHLSQPYHALCAADCTGTDNIPDPFDFDNNLGINYSDNHSYPQNAGIYYDKDFWKLYQKLEIGRLYPSGHESIRLGEENENHVYYPDNKYGYHRWYTIEGNGKKLNVKIENVLINGQDYCNINALNIALFYKGEKITSNRNFTSCSELSFESEVGKIYILVVSGFGDYEVDEWEILLSEL